MWWLDVLAGVLIVVGVFAFVSMARWRTRWLSSHTDRTAEDLYSRYADPPRRTRRGDDAGR